MLFLSSSVSRHHDNKKKEVIFKMGTNGGRTMGVQMASKYARGNPVMY